MEGEQRPANEGSSNGTGSQGNQVGAPTPAVTPSPLPPPPAPPQAPQYGPPPQAAPQPPPYQPPAYPQQPPYQPAPQAPYQPPPSYPPAGQQAYQAPGAPATYAPPVQPGYGQQPMQPGFAPPPAKKRSPMLLIVGLVAVFLILVLGGGGALANASLSSTYSPAKAVRDYLAAQSRGDVTYMLANANFLKGDAGTDQFFGKDAVTAMMGISDNKAISGVSVSSTEQVDSSTSKVAVAMTWGSNQRTQTYTVHRDRSRAHFVFYNDWKIDVPASTVTFTLPNQAGAVQIDGFNVPSGSTSVSVIQGFHTVTMQSSKFYDTDNETANAVDGTASVSFAGKWSSAATAGAAKAINDTFANFCDTAKYFDCTGHMYHPSAGHYDILHMPGGDVNAYSSWIFTFASDPTAGMKLAASSTSGAATASNACALKLVVDGKTTINYTGDWTANLTYNSSGDWGVDLTFNCDKAKA